MMRSSDYKSMITIEKLKKKKDLKCSGPSIIMKYKSYNTTSFVSGIGIS